MVPNATARSVHALFENQRVVGGMVMFFRELGNEKAAE
jgi:hypothetical protein